MFPRRFIGKREKNVETSKNQNSYDDDKPKKPEKNVVKVKDELEKFLAGWSSLSDERASNLLVEGLEVKDAFQIKMNMKSIIFQRGSEAREAAQKLMHKSAAI